MKKLLFTTLALIFASFFASYCQGDLNNLSGNQYHSAEMFMGEPVFMMEELFEGRGGRNIIATPDGAILAFHRNHFRKSNDGGKTWGEAQKIGDGVSGSNAVFNESNGEILFIHPNGYMWKSKDYGQSWNREEIEILPNTMMHGSPDGVPLVLWAMQPGITLEFSEYKGRLLLPSRIWRVTDNPRVFPWKLFMYSNAIYSDDNGKTWQSSAPFPDGGTGEGSIAELSNGNLLYFSRKHYFDKRYPEKFTHNLHYAVGYDGGENWEDLHMSTVLPDGPRHRSEKPEGMNFNGHFGLMGGLVRLPVRGEDILIYSNVDTPTHHRIRNTVWASFDGGETWPVKRLVYEGPAAYSVLGVGRADTPGEGKIFMLFEGGPKGPHSAVNVAVFNLSWLLDGRDLNEFMVK